MLRVNTAIGVITAFWMAVATAATGEVGVTTTEIHIGQSAGLTGPAAPQIKELTSGAVTYIDSVNKKGGVNGRAIVLDSIDDGIDPKRTMDNTKKLLFEKHVFALFLYRGTPNIEAVLPLIEQERVPLIAPSSGAQSMFTPLKKYIFPIRPSYHDEAEAIVQHLATLHMIKVAVFYEDAAFGKDVLAGIEDAMKARDLRLASSAPYPRGTTDVGAAVQTIAKVNPQSVIVVGAANASIAFVKKMHEAGIFPQFIALSTVSNNAFLQGLGPDGLGLGVTQITPFPWSSGTPLTREFNRLMQANHMEPSYLALEGYMSAKVLVEAIRRAGPEPTREKLVIALEGMHDYDLGGVVLHFNDKQHYGSKFVEITVIGKEGRFLR